MLEVWSFCLLSPEHPVSACPLCVSTARTLAAARSGGTPLCRVPAATGAAQPRLLWGQTWKHTEEKAEVCHSREVPQAVTNDNLDSVRVRVCVCVSLMCLAL